VHAKPLPRLLRRYQRVGGPRRWIVDVKPFSPQAIEARTQGVRSKATRGLAGTVEQEVFLGAHVSSTMGDSVLPLVDAETSVEYELTRAIATSTDKRKQLTIGVLATDLMFLGPLVNDERPEWSFNTALRELKKTYRFKPISAADFNKIVSPPDAAAKAEPETVQADGATSKKPEPPMAAPDVLLVVGPSSLPQAALDDLVKYVQSGRAVLILEDPLPFYWAFRSPDSLGVFNAPRQPRVDMRAPARPFLTEFSEEKAFGGSPIPLLSALGIEWNNGCWHESKRFQALFIGLIIGETWPKYYEQKT
jgi:ABC-2 type transport system permease protein